MILMRAMTDIVIDLPDSKSDDKVVKPDININKSPINQNKSNKLDLTDLKDLKIPKQRKERTDKGHKHVFKKVKIIPKEFKPNIEQSKKHNIPIWVVGIVVIFAIGIFFIKYKMPSTQNQRSIFQ